VMVAGLSLLAWYYGRKFHPLVLIFLVAATTALINPFYFWGDAGWYMSFFAFAGVLILAPLIHAYFWGQAPVDSSSGAVAGGDQSSQKVLGGRRQNASRLVPKFSLFFSNVRQIFVETMSAQLLTMPIIALMLGQFAPYGLLANLLVLPIVPLTMLLTFIAGVVAWVLPMVGPIVGWPAQVMLDYIIWVSQQVASLPGAAQAIDLGIVGFIAFMIALVVAMVYMQRRTKHSFRDSNVVE